MRTTFDLPDELMRHLKARAALEGRSLRDLVLELVERGLKAPPVSAAAAPPAGLPTVRLGRSLGLPTQALNHADLSALADE
jgi:plasmid stability protein